VTACTRVKAVPALLPRGARFRGLVDRLQLAGGSASNSGSELTVLFFADVAVPAAGQRVRRPHPRQRHLSGLQHDHIVDRRPTLNQPGQLGRGLERLAPGTH
jgi:hypothetical protein